MTTGTPAAPPAPTRRRTGLLLGVLGAVFVAGAVVPAVLASMPTPEIVLPAPQVTVVENALWRTRPGDGEVALGGAVVVDVVLEAEPTGTEIYVVSLTVHDGAGAPVATYDDAFTVSSARDRHAFLVYDVSPRVDLTDPAVDLADWSVSAVPQEGTIVSSAPAPEVTLSDASVYRGDEDRLRFRGEATVGQAARQARPDDEAAIWGTLVTRDADGVINGAALVFVDRAAAGSTTDLDGPLFTSRTTDPADFVRLELY